jgi:hypothetical protein
MSVPRQLRLPRPPAPRVPIRRLKVGKPRPLAVGRSKRAPRVHADEDILEGNDASLLELVDHVLTKGVVLDAELFLGVAGVDLIYLRLSAILCAADRILHPDAVRVGKGRR